MTYDLPQVHQRKPGRVAWMLGSLSMTLLNPGLLLAQVCNVPADYPTISAAVSDPACLIITVSAGVFPESVTVPRTLTLEGVGAADTTLAGALIASGSNTALTLRSFGIDISLPQAECVPAALAVTNGAVVYPANVIVNAVSDNCSPVELIFADGFEL